MFPFSLWHCLTSRSAPPHSPGKERLKEILPLSAFIYYTYTYRNTVAFLLGIPLRAAVKLYRWSTRAQPSVLLKGMSEDPGHPRFDPANRTASPGSYLPRRRATEGGGGFVVVFTRVPYVFAVPLVWFTAVSNAQNRCSVDTWWVGGWADGTNTSVASSGKPS